MESFSILAKSVSFKKIGREILLNDKDPCLEFIGAGRSAFAFRIKSTNKVLKVFFPAFHKLASEEAEIYKLLAGDVHYPKLYDSGDNYLVIDFVEGKTLFNCLVEGIPITDENIKEIDNALGYAVQKGLNPSDIHLRNIILTPGARIMIIDVARFRQVKHCTQWRDLRTAFYKIYNHKIFPKKIPAYFLNLFALLYKKNLLPSFYNE